MNYLELCQKVVRMGAITPGDTQPVKVTDQTGRMRLVVDWVSQANREIQSERNDFSFRIRAIDLQVNSGDEYIRPLDQHDDIESMNEMTASVRNQFETQPIGPIHWMAYRSARLQAGAAENALPVNYSVDTVGDIHFIPASTQDYIFRAEFKLAPQILRFNTDIPYIPEGYHDAIVYKALMYFYEYDESPQWDSARLNYEMWLSKLISATTSLNDWNYNQSSESVMVMTCD